jgi:hypothetical protein
MNCILFIDLSPFIHVHGVNGRDVRRPFERRRPLERTLGDEGTVQLGLREPKWATKFVGLSIVHMGVIGFDS